MKKLLLILLIPIIGFGQNKFSQNSSSYKTKNNTTKDEYNLVDDYKLLSFPYEGKNNYTNLKFIIDKMNQDGFELMKNANREIFFNYKLISPCLVFTKRIGLFKSQTKIMHTWDRDPKEMVIWKIENTIRLFKKKKEDTNINALFDYGIKEKGFTLTANDIIYDYELTANSLFDGFFLDNLTYANVKIYTVDFGDCPIYEDGSIIKECQFALIMGQEKTSDILKSGKKVKGLEINYSIEHLGIAELVKSYESITEKVISKKIRIPIIKEGNMNFISINIGGKSYKYLLDTGASDMVLNAEMKDYLMKIGVLKSSDFGQSRLYEIANGQKLRLKTATLNSIEIDGHTFNNIPIAIGDDASLLLGMSFLDKFHWRINNNTLELEKK